MKKNEKHTFKCSSSQNRFLQSACYWYKLASINVFYSMWELEILFFTKVYCYSEALPVVMLLLPSIRHVVASFQSSCCCFIPVVMLLLPSSLILFLPSSRHVVASFQSSCCCFLPVVMLLLPSSRHVVASFQSSCCCFLPVAMLFLPSSHHVVASFQS